MNQVPKFRVLVRDAPRRAVVLCHVDDSSSPPSASRSRALQGRCLEFQTGSPAYHGHQQYQQPQQPQSIPCSINLVDSASTIANGSGYRQLAGDAVWGCIGLIHHANDTFLGLIQDAAPVCDMAVDKSTVYRVTSVRLLSMTSNKDPYDYNNNSNSSNNGEGNVLAFHPAAQLGHFLSKGTFYFAPGSDLTRNTQQRKLTSPPDYNSRFMWNGYLLAPLLEYDSLLAPRDQHAYRAAGFMVPLIQGFVGSTSIPYNGSSLSIAVISRISGNRTGARFLTRGIDDDGNVANEVETETICTVGSMCFTYTQLRGSVPLFWEQSGPQMGAHKVYFPRPPEASAVAFQRHMGDLLKRYKRVHVVDLLRQNQGRTDGEAALSGAYQGLVADLGLPQLVSSTVWDYHGNNGRSTTTDPVGRELIPQLNETLSQYEYFLADVDQKSVLSRQIGVLRTNCLDCLDRTNVVQCAISRTVTCQFLAHVFGQTSGAVIQHAIDAHNNLWAASGDAVSHLYAGAGAIGSGTTRQAKSGWMGLLEDATRTLGRLYQNTFQDRSKQDIIDTFQGRTLNSVPVVLHSEFRDELLSRVNSCSAEFSSKRTVTMYSTTFNLCGSLPQMNEDLARWIAPHRFNPDPKAAAGPDVLVYGFQELIELKASKAMSGDGNELEVWERFLDDVINGPPRWIPGVPASSSYKRDYYPIATESLVGLAIIVFVHTRIAGEIRSVETATTKTGLGGLVGSKGAVAVRMDVFDTSVALVNSHLAAGQSSAAERCADVRSINANLCFARQQRFLDHHDLIFWMGDLNFRNSCDYAEALNMIASDNIHGLFMYDQLGTLMANGDVFIGYYEGDITFPPTYKYDVASDRYDTSEKMRIPSWTDRIMYRGFGIKLIEYNSAQRVRISDHKPVYATFEGQVDLVNQAKRKVIWKSI
ncbi:DNase I-like protein, partial [Ramicandelaber brevisporus]